MSAMRPSRPLARELAVLVLASAMPAAAVAAALAASAYDPDWQNALMLVMSAVALAAGAYCSCLIARGLRLALEDIAADARMLGEGRPLAAAAPRLDELAAIAAALAAAAPRFRAPAPPPPQFNFAEGAAGWSRTVASLYQAGARGSAVRAAAEPALAWCDPVAVLTRLAQTHAARAASAGIALDFEAAATLRAVRGTARDLEAALGELIDAALEVTSRGGRIVLAAREVAAGTLKLVLGVEGRAAGAGGMIELTSGANLARCLARARELVEAAGGTLVPGAGAVTIYLVSVLAGQKAA